MTHFINTELILFLTFDTKLFYIAENSRIVVVNNIL